jgi:hypothetical protein
VSNAYESKAFAFISRPHEISVNIFLKRFIEFKSIPFISLLKFGLEKNLLAALPSFVFPFSVIKFTFFHLNFKI